MISRSKLLFAALVAAGMLALVTGASADRLSVSEKEFEFIFRQLTFEAGGNNITCPITLLGGFLERTIPKSSAQIGKIKHVTPREEAAPPCTGGRTTVLTETLPWRVNYVNFGGVLPTILTIRLSVIGAAFRVSTGSLGCLAGTTTINPAYGELSLVGGSVSSFRVDEVFGIPLGGSFICEFALSSHWRGEAEVKNLPGIARLTITLI